MMPSLSRGPASHRRAPRSPAGPAVVAKPTAPQHRAAPRTAGAGRAPLPLGGASIGCGSTAAAHGEQCGSPATVGCALLVARPSPGRSSPKPVGPGNGRSRARRTGPPPLRRPPPADRRSRTVHEHRPWAQDWPGQDRCWCIVGDLPCSRRSPTEVLLVGSAPAGQRFSCTRLAPRRYHGHQCPGHGAARPPPPRRLVRRPASGLCTPCDPFLSPCLPPPCPPPLPLPLPLLLPFRSIFLRH